MIIRRNNEYEQSAFPQSSVSDIAFLLMVFFILTTAWAAPHILRISSGISSQNVRAEDVSDIVIKSDSVTIDGISVTEETLAEQLKPNHKYRILPDDNAVYQDLVHILNILQEHGINKVQVVSDET